ncbi:4-hydroxythreonine-4-phosphate dehydrogenase PdxA [Methylophaga nitratireducenticrescens]|uniref:4-hydroxythreonine-4-phosphate dehydrogenase PdxA n=1 Tax=Methylophaga nitratireducenticrescens TaxID=754476 RepID=UPI000CDCD007|nr:4-hydroxythreonine-4-phosphate dehydrogenase PdxA [Methylophaga nitratireducenticrescens]AUZ85031.1 4-hydroxythreonine-4-phosphate dehydrogenase PdxA [Methylophaga nitratireducenticrescens]
MSDICRIALTSGEPAGIGPDLCIQLAQQGQRPEIVVIADPELLQQRADELSLPLKLVEFDPNSDPKPGEAGRIVYLASKLAEKVVPGKLNPANSAYVIDTLQLALNGCLDGTFDAVVTAPVHKGVINDAQIPFSGHTEFFADGAGVNKVVMMLATPELRVALATTHLPLREVSDAVTQQSLLQIMRILANGLHFSFGLKHPRIAVCGLNPHAGEGGHLGAEEQTVIEPAIKLIREQGYEFNGPWPADTIFVKSRLAEYDAVLAMYHDQGLPVLKHQGFGDAVNITLGLPFIRTSVDHGTALDLAASGNASATSLQAAINMAETMSLSRRTA